MSTAVKEGPKIAICGAGISGLALAGMLSKELGPKLQLKIFERAPEDRDQGYGLDLDEYGQEALARAGLYHRYWDFSKPYSDSWSVCPMHFRGATPEPYLIMFRPKLLQKMFAGFGAQPESNRAAFRAVILEALAERGNNEIFWGLPATDIREIKSDEVDVSRAELLAADGKSLGTFDVVVDASGLHSPLRHHRVIDEAKKVYAGSVLVHGIIDSPEDVWPKELLNLFGRHGNLVGAGVKSRIGVQRFGCSVEDNRTAVLLDIRMEGGDEAVFREIGIERPTSRKTGIITDAERMAKVKGWVHESMGDHFDPLWHSLIDSMNRITIRSEYRHGPTELRDNVSLPLICIGDSLRNCGIGGGGNLALQDATDLASALAAPGVFDEVSGKLRSLETIRKVEPTMLERKKEFNDKKDKAYALFDTLSKNGNREFSFKDLPTVFPNFWTRLGVQFCFSFVRPILKAWYRLEASWGCAGSDSTSRVFGNVQAVLDAQKKGELSAKAAK
eukprot:CAMPEP_0206526470 /NCGR_PEP_ID=MMETSP0325_2-20121206/756_1 /ASSEMBLY_ACC=CAM_ASM_000347 /TAXON_ID=2866 /ORGANISM="Crypthecodinium cohnii, Strain Seligo" /LENGTH=501 /DNA_ID=CAMNT_0054021663 /DNA_START=293 /DNA_END=1798 /DNA_ORIENTATION=+